MKRSPQNAHTPEEFYITVKGEKIPVTEEVYYAYKRPAWKERKRRQVRGNKEDSLDAFLALGQEIPDADAVVEQIVEDQTTLDSLLGALSRLSNEERALIQALFYEGKSEREVAKEWGNPYTTINYRKNQLLQKLRKLL